MSPPVAAGPGGPDLPGPPSAIIRHLGPSGPPSHVDEVAVTSLGALPISLPAILPVRGLVHSVLEGDAVEHVELELRPHRLRSPAPNSRRVSSALSAMFRGSRMKGCLLSASKAEQMKLSVGKS